MRRFGIFAIMLCMLVTLGALPTAAEDSAQLYPTYLATVVDVDDLLSAQEELEVNRALDKARAAAGVPICAYVTRAEIGYDGHVEYTGEDFLAEYGLSDKSPMVLLIVSVTYFEIFYDIYTYGDAYAKINQKEIDYILDDSRVYDNIKEGEIADGLCAYASLSAEAYAGRLGVSWQLILIFALIIGAVVAWLAVKGIVASYKTKNPTQSYPLDRFAQLELTRNHDRVLGKFVTHTIISTGGGRGGHGGGGVGGGGGHRGGR